MVTIIHRVYYLLVSLMNVNLHQCHQPLFIMTLPVLGLLYTTQLDLPPVGITWLRETCRKLGLQFIAHNGVRHRGPDAQLKCPNIQECVSIRGDGNCFFRSISHNNRKSTATSRNSCNSGRIFENKMSFVCVFF